MSYELPWYGTAEGELAEQGDFLADCPIIRSDPKGGYRTVIAQVVILSHSCDLANDKLDIVQVCPYRSLENLAADIEFLRGRRGREELRRGGIAGYHLLNRCALAGFEREFMVVDFRSTYGIPIESIKAQCRIESPRLRLLPPYREHLAQAFARFFMRVGLPLDIPAF